MAFKILLTGADEVRRVKIKGNGDECIAALTAALSAVLASKDCAQEEKLRRLAKATGLIASDITGRKCRVIIE